MHNCCRALLSLWIPVFAFGCANEASQVPESGGGSYGIGGALPTGGVVASGGAPSSGGISQLATGGTVAIASSASTLGTTGGGATAQAGGSTASGGVGNTSAASGGTSVALTGGSSGTGGTRVALGGGVSLGGAFATGGNLASGGTPPATGGTSSITFSNADEEILYRSVRFYGAERCGDNHNWTLADNAAGHSCHMRDGETVGLDLTGGWHDAGDHVKVTLTIAYAAYILLKAYETYPSAFKDYDDPSYSGRPNGIPDVLDEARFGLDWLVKAHPDANRLVAMVANSNYDHATFMTSPTQSLNTPERGGDPRPVQMGAKADFAGTTAAALALASRLYATFDAAQSAVYLAKAKTAYTFAKANPGLSTSMLYAWTGMQYNDDLMCGAAELWRATGDGSYRSDAVSRNTSIGSHKSVASYAQVSDFCRHSLVKGGEQSALSPWSSDVDRYATMQSTDANIKGLLYLDKWGTCRYAMAASFSAALLFDVTKNTKYRDFARAQYAWVKGQNPQSRSYIIGWGTNPPTRPHHRNAYGYEDDNGWDADTPQLSDTRAFHYLLKGALVGGPNLDGYQDSVNDYVHNEVAIDYNAGLVGTAAFAVANP